VRKYNRPALAEELAALKELCKTGRAPKLYRNTKATTPMLIGLFSPSIVLPDREYTGEQLHSVLLHELTHLRRKDVLVKWLSVPACAVHWFNPIVWLTHRELDRACELSCDEAVIRDLDENGKHSYGETLLYVAADGKTPRAVLSTTMCEEKRDLKERLGAIMKSKKRTRVAVIVSAAVICVAVLAVCALGAGSGSNSQLSFSSAKTQSVTFANGTNGGRYFIDDDLTAQFLVQTINDFKFRRSQKLEPSTGWEIGIDIDLAEGSSERIVMREDGIAYRGYLYANGKENALYAFSKLLITDRIECLHFIGGQSKLYIFEADTGRSDELDVAVRNTSFLKLVKWLWGLRINRVNFVEGQSPGDGDGGEVYSLDNGYGEVSYVKNGADDCFVLYGGDWYKVQNPSDPPLEELNAAGVNSNADYPADTNMVKRGALESIVEAIVFDDSGVTVSIPVGIIPSREYPAPVKLAIEVGGLDDSIGDRNFPVFTGWEENIENAAGQEFSVPLWNIGGAGAHFALTFSDGETLYYSALYADWLKANGKTPLDHTPGYIYPMINGYITNFNMETRTFDFDEAQWLDSIKDVDYLKEIGVDPDSLPNGFYIHNPDAAVRTVTVMPGTSILIQSADGLKPANIEEFSNLLNDGRGQRLFEVEFVDDKASVIMERYLP
jgi:hypothetical protein